MHKVIRASAPLAVLLLAVLPTAAVDAAGSWKGAIRIPQTSLEVIVDLRVDEGDVWSGEIDIPLQGAKDLPLGGFEAEGSSLTFAILNVPGSPTFHGTLSDDGATLSGDFTQSGQTFPFSLERVAARGEAAPRKAPGEALQDLDALVEETLETWKVPAAGIAVVADGRVYVSRGYGFRDVEKKLPADERTLFSIGSATKGFTAMVVGQQVDAGRLSWDEPVRTYLPRFALEDRFASEGITPRDLLCHRSGLPRHDLVWYGSRTPRAELVARLAHLEPTAAFRTRFQYQNLMFVTAGYLAGQVAGSTWEELVRERIFAPLGMGSSGVRLADLLAEENRALGYYEKKEEGSEEKTLEVMDYRDIDNVGPAGSIVSNAADMARWLSVQLGGGEVDGKRIVEAATLAEMHRPQVVVDEPIISALFAQPEMPHIMYGLGWFVQPYRGHEMIHHGGNIDGFSALVSFLPDDRAGVVVLTNKNGTPATTVLALGVFDRLLGLEPVDWSGRYELIYSRLEASQEKAKGLEELDRREGTSPSHSLDEYPGRYENEGYGIAEVTLEDGKLAVSYNAIRSPLEHWHYDTFRATAKEAGGVELTFATDVRGYVDRISALLQPGAGPIVFERLPDAGLDDPAYRATLVGDYEQSGLTVTVDRREDGALTLTVPGQPTYILEPVRRDEFRLAGLEGYSVRFVREGGAVVRALFIQPNGVFRADRR